MLHVHIVIKIYKKVSSIDIVIKKNNMFLTHKSDGNLK